MLGTSEGSSYPSRKLWTKSPQTRFSGRGREQILYKVELDACLPWQWSEKREGEPPQASGFDKMTSTGAHRVTIDPARVNHWTPTAFYGVIKADDDWFLFDQICHEMLEKSFRQLTRFPLGAIENLVGCDFPVAVYIFENMIIFGTFNDSTPRLWRICERELATSCVFDHASVF